MAKRLEVDHSLHRGSSADPCLFLNDRSVLQGNDLCGFCDDLDKHSPSQFTSHIRDTLDRLYAAKLPRALINVVLVLDVRSVEELNSGGLVCNVLHRFLCPCAAFPSANDTKTLNDWIPQYQNEVSKLIQSGRYDQRDDFTVVVQPFLTRTELPRKDNGKVDFSYFAPDCFHFSGHFLLSPLCFDDVHLSFRQRSCSCRSVLVEQHVRTGGNETTFVAQRRRIQMSNGRSSLHLHVEEFSLDVLFLPSSSSSTRREERREDPSSDERIEKARSSLGN